MKTLRDYEPSELPPRDFEFPREASMGDSAPPRTYPGVGEVQGTGNRMGFEDGSVDVSITSGAFYGTRTVVSGGADNGDIYLQGGTGGGVTVNEFLLYDASLTTWSGSPGQHLQLEMTGTGSETNGILDPIFTVSTATLSIVTTLGTNTFPSSGDLSGKKCFVSLGSFFDGGFAPADVGNVPCTFCWGGYDNTR